MIGDSRCRSMLECIESTVTAAVATRWSAGASILAFIPTVLALMSNSILDILLIGEESDVLALALALSSFTGFFSRFGISQESPRSITAIQEEVDHKLKLAFAAKANSLRRQKMLRTLLLVAIITFLLAVCAAIWLPVRAIMRNGVVTFSCDVHLHVPVWIALTRFIAAANVALRGHTMHSKRIDLNGQAPQKKPQPPPAAWPRTMILRHPKTTISSQLIRAVTSLLSVTLYAFATGVLGAMTMIPASDAIRYMVMFAVVAGVGRMIAEFANYAPHWKSTIVVDVMDRQMEDVKMFAVEAVQTFYRPLA